MNFTTSKSSLTIKNFSISLSFIIIIACNVSIAQSSWLEKESDNFKVIYREAHSHLSDHLLYSAEKSLSKLKELFDYTPKEKIIINTYDVYDFGFASATSVPQNFIRLEIEPFEPGYENIPYNERFQWVISHELVHIVVNDASTNWEKFFRAIFSKVQPEQEQPSTVLFSLLTNYSRYTPHWHQEAIAVFWETWLSGGFGRVLGSYDEMYFRAMVNDSQNFPCPIELDSKFTHNSINLEKLFYLYGGRFATYLAIHYSIDKVVDWFKVEDDEFYNNFQSKFEDIFGDDLFEVWREFTTFEIKFQSENLKKLSGTPTSDVKKLYHKSFGWVTQPFYDKITNNVIFGYHTSGKLSSIQKLNLSNNISEDIETLPTPSMHQVASTAYSSSKNRFFYTTNNNQLYRDLWYLHLGTGENKLLFEDYRVGSITVSEKTNELWGIQHSGGSAALVYSAFPYSHLRNIIQFDVGDEVSQLSVSPSGEKLAAIIHRADGNQFLVMSDCNAILQSGRFQYETLYSKGSPENPSWNNSGETIFWNAFTNGVSNIYRMNLADRNALPISHNLTGLVKPIYLSEEKLFAFEYHYDGFIPVEIPNQPIEYLPAIKYLGQEIIDLNPDIFKWTIYPNGNEQDSIILSEEDSYNSLANLNILSFVPTVSGFQDDVMIGLYTHISDPLIIHDLKLEFGITPFNKNSLLPYYHFRGRYDYRKKFEILVEHNAPDFYDLFNKRKVGIIGTRVNVSYSNFWLYDNPHKIKQKTDVTYYTGVKFFNDNSLEVLVEDFLVAQTVFNSKYLRRSIGSSDYEDGNEFTLSLVGFGQTPKDPDIAGHVFGEWSLFKTWLAKHNVFHLKLDGGYHFENENLVQAKFYFGGFGNRYVENKSVKQFRKVFRFPGVPIYSLVADSFGKFLIENSFPPIRFSSLSFFGRHYLSHIDISIYSQGLFLDFPNPQKYINAGAQLSILFKHWFNLESTVSAGAANAWWNGESNFEWFVSLKLLKN